VENTKPALPIRGYLLHITHYDPVWCETKDREEPFDVEIGLDIVDGMASVDLNLLVIDCADGLQYQSHPELTRHYSQPIATLERLVRRAGQQGIEVVPLLNFAQSEVFQNNHWFRPHNDLFDNDTYWQFAFEVMDELIAVIQPPRFFHIGMDEDHWRSHRQYVAAIQTLRGGLARRHLRTVVWNASALRRRAVEVFKEKSLVAEGEIAKDIVQVIFDYADVQPGVFRRVLNAGFEVWGAPGTDPGQMESMRDVLLSCGGTGILLTRWMPCVPANRDNLLDHIRTLGPLCSQPAD
jgi:hypothetical protein